MEKPNGKIIHPLPSDFENGIWFDWQDSEELQHKTPEDAIVDWANTNWSYHDDFLGWLASQPPLTVTAYAPMPIPWKWIEAVSGGMIDYLEDSFHEEFGDPYCADEVFSPKIKQELSDKLAFLIQDPLERAHMWACDSYATRDYSLPEIEVILREACPEWFESVTQDD